MNLMTFDIVLTPPVGIASFTQSITILSGRRERRKQKIKRIWPNDL
jgi:hypothetical protein